jgi:hypothetical protein
MIGGAQAKSLKQVGLAEMQDDLSRDLRLADEEEIVITRHGSGVRLENTHGNPRR